MYNFKKIDQVSHRFMKFCNIYKNIDNCVIVRRYIQLSDYRVGNVEILYTQENQNTSIMFGTHKQMFS